MIWLVVLMVAWVIGALFVWALVRVGTRDRTPERDDTAAG